MAQVDPVNVQSDTPSVSRWWPYLLTVPAFLDIILTGFIIYRERGPGGSLEYQLCPCYTLPSTRAPEPGTAAPSRPATAP